MSLCGCQLALSTVKICGCVSVITTIQSCISLVSDHRLSSSKYLLNDSQEEPEQNTK